jgi:hypothetical protein
MQMIVILVHVKAVRAQFSWALDMKDLGELKYYLVGMRVERNDTVDRKCTSSTSIRASKKLKHLYFGI